MTEEKYIELFSRNALRNMKKRDRAAWMASYHEALKAREDYQDAAQRSDDRSGFINWDSAVYLFNTGVDPKSAAFKATASIAYNKLREVRSGDETT